MIHEPHDLAWAAGYLDGEGSFAVYGERGPTVQVGSTNPLPLQRLAALFGGEVRDRGPQPGSFSPKRVWKWRLNGARAQAVARQCEPFMIEKREQAAMVALCPNGGNRWYPLTAAQLQLRADIDAWLRHVKTLGA